MPDDEVRVVISGISGVYPKCNNIEELEQKLFAEEDLITDLPNWNFSVGKLNSVKKFDAGFFNITNEHAEYMDPMCRILLEKTFEAITDSGYNVQELRNSRTAVYVANCTSDAEVESTFRKDVKGALICERAQSFLANRISYCFGFLGPSATLNTACSSSLYALNFAFKAIKDNECDAAIVGGSNLCLAPGMVHLYKNLGITSTRCKSFDDAANGFCRSEAVSVIFLQKSKDARRLYTEVVNVKTNNDGYKKQSILFPSHQSQSWLINQVYRECQVLKSQVTWVEAHGTGTRVGDYQEMKSLETLCENREMPLLVGCVKSNLGHTEAASGLCSIAKVIISMETNKIPPNLHFHKPQNGIDALITGKVKIITKTTPWDGGYVAVNNFGIGGANAHLILKSHSINKIKLVQNIPALILVSGRTEQAIEKFIDYFKMNSLDVEHVGLLHKVFSKRIPNHEYRGHIVVQDDKVVSSYKQRIKSNRPLWFIYPGMGSQWPGMAKQLLKIDMFHRSISECHQILLKKDIDLLTIISSENTTTFQNILNCFIGITAVMISLTDLLNSLGLKPDGVIGHSFGEICCAYSVNCLSKEEALLLAYYRGLTSVLYKPTMAKGMMAVVGINGANISKICPQSLEVVCYNGKNSCTVAGPVNSMQIFIQQLKAEHIYVTNIFSGDIAYHSSYIKPLGIAYRNYLKTVLQNSCPRPSKWISSTSQSSEYCSPEYFESNLVCPVRFEDALKHIPNNAVTVEIAPHCILKSVLNSTLNSTVTNVSLVNKNHGNHVQGLLKALGTLYTENIDYDVSKLYPPISFPVSRGTPMIAPLIKWNHEKDWYVPFESFNPATVIGSNDNQLVMNFDKEWKYLKGLIIDDRQIIPQSTLLKIVLELIQKKREIEDCTVVVFKNVTFHQQLEIPIKGSRCLMVHKFLDNPIVQFERALRSKCA